MSQFNDARFAALRGQGFTGSTNDMLLQWALANGGVTPHINDAILEMLLANGAVTPHISDAWYEFLIALGFGPGHRNDMEFAFWEAGGSIGPQLPTPTGAFAGGSANCAILALTEFTVVFSDIIVFTPVAAPTTAPNGFSILINAVPATFNVTAGTGTDTWTGTLATDVLATDVFSVEYIGPGLTDAALNPLDPFGPYGVNNCNDGSGFGPGFGPGFD